MGGTHNLGQTFSLGRRGNGSRERKEVTYSVTKYLLIPSLMLVFFLKLKPHYYPKHCYNLLPKGLLPFYL